jgi:hypothetical protein
VQEQELEQEPWPVLAPKQVLGQTLQMQQNLGSPCPWTTPWQHVEHGEQQQQYRRSLSARECLEHLGRRSRRFAGQVQVQERVQVQVQQMDLKNQKKAQQEGHQTRSAYLHRILDLTVKMQMDPSKLLGQAQEQGQGPTRTDPMRMNQGC